MSDTISNNACKNCPYEATINELKRDCERNSEQHREFYKRFNDGEKAQAILDERYNTILSTLSKLEVSVNELKEKPTKRWDSIVTYVITAIVGAVIGAVMNGVF